MSGSGQKVVVYNTRERLVSTDLDRTESFIGYDRAEILRRLMSQRSNAFGGPFIERGGYVSTFNNDLAGIETPLRGDVIEGLAVLPLNGTPHLLVEPGVVLLDDPDGQSGSSDAAPPSADDSRCKIVTDPGMLTAGVLTVPPADPSFDRIDIVECRRTTQVLEADNRDIFDPSTGTFVPVAVPKVTAGRLTYRVRSGTPGSGTIARVQGWLPLAVIVVPAGVSFVEQMALWDVRPLVQDRLAPPTPMQAIRGLLDDPEIIADDVNDVNATRVLGTALGRFGMYHAGGTVDVDVRAPANQVPGYSAIPGTLWHLWAVFPFGLPRWVRYTGSPLVPFGPRGILTVSATGPTTFNAQATVQSIACATGSGITGNHPATHLASGIVDAGGIERGHVTDGDSTYLSARAFAGAPSLAPSGSTNDRDLYTLTAGLHYPVNARTVRVRLTTQFNGSPGAFVLAMQHVSVQPPAAPDDPAQAIAQVMTNITTTTIPPAGFVLCGWDAVVPVNPGSSQLLLRVPWSAGSLLTRTANTARVVGWRLGRA